MLHSNHIRTQHAVRRSPTCCCAVTNAPLVSCSSASRDVAFPSDSLSRSFRVWKGVVSPLLSNAQHLMTS